MSKKRGSPEKGRLKTFRKSVRFRRLLVPVDFSENSLYALIYAAKLARRLEAELTVLHVIYDPPEAPGLYAEAQAHHLAGSIVDLASAARSMLDDFVSRSRVRKKRRLRLLCEPGIPSTRIVEVARAHRTDLIVMASHAGGLRRFFLGSTAERVARSAHCPVLFARLPDDNEPAALGLDTTRPPDGEERSARSN